MKKPIDPNLGSLGDEVLFTIGDDNGSAASSRGEGAKEEFTVTEVTHTEEKAAAGDGGASEQSRSTDSEHHHHHSSDGGHHHSSSGSHHSSSGHHSSGSSHGSRHHHHHHRHSSSSKKKKKDKLPLPARIAIILLLILLAFALTVGGVFGYNYLKGRKELTSAPVTSTDFQETITYKGHTYKYNSDVFALAFMGIDQRTLQTSEETDFVGASDTDIVVAVNTKTGDVKVIAIPRDTMVEIDVYTGSNVFLRTQKAQLCLAYAYGDGRERSCINGVNAMSRVLLGVPIQKYYALDLDGIKPLNDAIGGVTLKALYTIPEQGIYEGKTVTLKGDMAEAYIRMRDKKDINASLGRTQRQVQYIKQYANSIVPAVIKDFSVATGLYNTSMDYSQTNLTLSNVTYLGTLLLSKGVTDFETSTLKGTMKASDDPLIEGIVHAEFYPDDDSRYEIVLDAFYTQID